MANIPDGYMGVQNVPPSDTALSFGNEMVLPKARGDWDVLKTQNNQDLVSANSCTINTSAGSCTDNTGYAYATQQIINLWNQAEALGAFPIGASNTQGWTIEGAVNEVCQNYNSKFPKDPLMVIPLQVNSAAFLNAIELNYSPIMGYAGNQAYNTDAHDDGVLEGVSFPNPTYQHCIRWTNFNTTYVEVVDNYPQDPDNVYRIPKGNISALVDNSVYFPEAYILVYANDYAAINNNVQIPTYAQVAVQLAIKNGILNDQTDVNTVINCDPFILNSLQDRGIINVSGQKTIAQWCLIFQRLNLIK